MGGRGRPFSISRKTRFRRTSIDFVWQKFVDNYLFLKIYLFKHFKILFLIIKLTKIISIKICKIPFNVIFLEKYMCQLCHNFCRILTSGAFPADQRHPKRYIKREKKDCILFCFGIMCHYCHSEPKRKRFTALLTVDYELSEVT